MGFMDGLLDVLSGPMAVKQIDQHGFDFREKRAQDEAARQQQRQQWDQANEQYAMKIGEDAIAGAGEGEQPDLSSLFPNADQSRRKLMIDALVGRGKERKSSLEEQKTYRDIMRQRLVGDQRLDQIEATGENAQALARVRADLEAGRQPSPRDLALIEKRGEVQTRLFDRAEAGRDRRFGSLLGGRRQLRLVSDGKGGTEYRWIAPGETAAGPPTATQRETAGMAGNISEVLSNMEEIAPDVTHGPIAGRFSEAWQSQYPSGEEADFDQYVKQLVDLAYIKSGKQINRQELEMQLRGLISRSKGDLPGQVRRAKPYIENILAPYERTGAISPNSGRDSAQTVTSREQAAALPVGSVFTLNGRKLRKVGPGSYEQVP